MMDKFMFYFLSVDNFVSNKKEENFVVDTLSIGHL